MGNVHREMEILRKNHKEMLEIQKSLTEMNAFGDLIRKLDMAEERISELEDMSIESSKTEKRTKT